MKRDAKEIDERIRIVEFTNPSGAIAYRVTGWKGRERIRENYKTEAEAKGRKADLLNEIENLPTVPLLRTKLTPAQASEAERAFDDLGKHSLLKAVQFFLANYQETDKPITMADAFPKFIAAQETEANSRPRTVRNLRSRIAPLAEKFPQTLVSEVLADAIRELIFRPGRSRRSQINDRAALGAFFSWAIEQHYCRTNPVLAIKRPKVDEVRPKILPLAACRKLVAAAAAQNDGAMLPYLALALFAGIRHEEICRLSWDSIDLKHRIVRIDGEAAKLRKLRNVEISKNCAEMLRQHSATRPPFVAANWRRYFDKVKEAAGYGAGDGLKPWTPDVLRHTSISFKLSQCSHEGETATWAGNSVAMVHKHYKGLVSKDDTRAFWKIEPSTKAENIVKLERAA
jgi:integrase/recombinase XerD